MKKFILILSTLLMFIDQLIKYFVIHNLELYKSIKLIPNFFYITFVKNDGAAFSILRGNRWLLIAIGIIALMFMIKLIIMDKKITKLDVVSYSLVIGGILGNLVDRILYGSVIDYLDFYLFGYNAPVFNFADSCIVIGAIIIICVLIKEGNNYESNNSR
ncbi:lipoprotein signal peptidase [Clostridium sp. CAG:1193]|nr:lipoprotein signal peptidase [Clostridium sp. CAG:1193]